MTLDPKVGHIKLCVNGILIILYLSQLINYARGIC